MEVVACRKHSGGLRSSFGGIGQSTVKFGHMWKVGVIDGWNEAEVRV